MSVGNFAPAALVTYANILRQNPRDGATLAKALQRICTDENALANQLAAAGFETDQLGNLSFVSTTFLIRELISRFQYEDPPDIQRIGGATAAIAFTGRWMRLLNTTVGSVTLTSTPTIGDPPANIAGRAPIAELFNVGAQNIVVQDQGTLAGSNLRLSANTITLGTRDSLILRYSSDIGDWVQIGNTNVL